MQEGRALVRDLEQTRRRILDAGGALVNDYRFTDTVLLAPGDSALDREFIRLRVYSGNTWPFKTALLIHKITEWTTSRSKVSKPILFEEFDAADAARDFVRERYGGLLRDGFTYERRGWHYRMDGALVFLEEVEKLGPTVEVHTENGDLGELLARLEGSERLEATVPETIRRRLQSGEVERPATGEGRAPGPAAGVARVESVGPVALLAARGPVTQKAADLVDMARAGLPVPRSIVGHGRASLGDTVQEALRHARDEPVLLRLCISDLEYPHELGGITPPAHLGRAAANLVARFDFEFDTVVQPLLDLEASGVIVLKPDGTALCEQVEGGLKTLVHDGVYAYRAILDPGGSVVREWRGTQESSLRLREGRWERRSLDGVPCLAIRVRAQVAGAGREDAVTAYEWGWTGEGIVLLDRKALPEESFPDLHRSAPGEGMVVYPRSRDGDNPAPTHLPAPDFAHVEEVQPGRDVRVASGAVLAHVGIHAALTRVAYEIHLAHPVTDDGTPA
jgi:hypothetical protein